MADITITLELTGLPAATALQLAFADQGAAPGWLWGTAPSFRVVRAPFTDGPWDAGEVALTEGTPPGFDPNNPGRPPKISMPTLQDVVDAVLADFRSATAWEIKIELAP